MSDDMKALSDLLAFAETEPEKERQPRTRGVPREDYRFTAAFLEEFGEPCDCGGRGFDRQGHPLDNGPGGQCPENPCPNRGAKLNTYGPSSSAVQAISEDEFYRRSRLPIAYRACRIANWQPQDDPRIPTVRGWAATWPPAKPFMVLMGSKGNGKTHLASGVMRDVWERHGKLPVFWSVRDLLSSVKATFDESATTTEAEIGRMLDYSPLVVLDDLGKEHLTEWSKSFMFGLIDRRYANSWPTLITSNAALADDPTTDRILDRQRTTLVLFTGPSWREKARTA